MKYAFVAAALAAPILAAPAKRQGTNIDTTVLQFALTLEHLENVFYKGALTKFSPEDFKKAGYGANYYYDLQHIAYDEQSHVQFLETALTAAGQTPVAPCTYVFPYTDVNSFITLSSVIEGVGTSAYLGGAPLITSKDYLTAAGSILVTEALHTSFQRNAVNEVPFPTPYGTPLDPTSVYSIASAFIKSCPPSNAVLPFTPYPALALKSTAGTCELPNCDPKNIAKRNWEASPAPTTSAPGKPASTVTVTNVVAPTGCPAPGASKGMDMPNKGADDWEGYGNAPPSSSKNMPAFKIGQTVTFTPASPAPAGSFITFVVGLTVTSVPGTISGGDISAVIPAAAQGQVYVFVTKAAAAGNKLDASSIVAGPAILEVVPAAPVIDFNEA